MAALNVEAMRARWERLSERERLLSGALMAAGVVVALTLVVFLVGSALGSLEDTNQELRQALRDIEEHRDAYLKVKGKASQMEARLGHGGFQLEGFLEQAATQSDVTILETTERQPLVIANKKYIERAVDLHIRNVKLDALSKFLRRIETGPNLVVVMGLKVLTRDDKHEDLDVEMTVSTWERAPDVKGAHKPGAGGKEKEKEGGGSGAPPAGKETKG